MAIITYDNFTVSEVTFTASQGNDLNLGGFYTLQIIPDEGYEVDASNFSLIAPLPPEIDASSITFTQNGTVIDVKLEFLPGALMPGNDLDVPLCFSGYALGNPYTIAGVVNINAIKASPEPKQPIPYNNSGAFEQTEIVYAQTITADAGYYFYQEPIAAISVGVAANYDIGVSKGFNLENELTSVTYNINYTYPAGSVSGDIINIQAIAIPSVVNTDFINAFSVSGVFSYTQPAIPNGGDTRVLNLVGDPGALFSISFFEDGSGTETVLATNVPMPITGQYSTAPIIFPAASASESPYRLVISGDINPDIDNVGNTIEISFAQTQAMTFTVTATSSSGDFSINGVNPIVFNAVPNYTYAPGDINTITYSWITSAVSGNDVVDVGSIDANSFNPVIPDPSYPGTLYSAGSFSSLLAGNEKSVKFQGTLTIQSTEDDPISHTIDIDSFIDEIAPPGSWVAARCSNPALVEKVSLTDGWSGNPSVFGLLQNTYQIGNVVWIKDTFNGTIYCAELISQDAAGTPTTYIDEVGGIFTDCTGPNACLVP